ncbi:hypothetical protein VTI74DRAFT_10443 [Chaetomium olivicolor]
MRYPAAATDISPSNSPLQLDNDSLVGASANTNNPLQPSPLRLDNLLLPALATRRQLIPLSGHCKPHIQPQPQPQPQPHLTQPRNQSPNQSGLRAARPRTPLISCWRSLCPLCLHSTCFVLPPFRAGPVKPQDSNILVFQPISKQSGSRTVAVYCRFKLLWSYAIRLSGVGMQMQRRVLVTCRL